MSQAQLLPTDHFSPSVTLHHGRPATTSLAIAEHFGKQHDRVLKDIRNVYANCPEKFSAVNFDGAEYTDEQGKPRPMFTVYFDGFILLVMGYTGKKALQIKLLYIAAFNAMRDELAAQREAALPEVPHFTITPSTPASRKPLRSLVNAWARISGQHQESLWPQVKAHFQLERIDDLPEEWIGDALEWVQGKIDEQRKALPSAEPATEHFPAGIPLERRDALEQIKRLIISLRQNCHPGAKTMKQSPDAREMRDILFVLYATAADNLHAAYNALDAGYKLGRLYGRG